ncbi:tumor necrosis factor receptor superfamily member 14-like isoform X6 [Scyliorhinus canicula]|uniref:tumor necrosis factor receptor superfamily member 14-like isoform X6 n=1 Tax=Scyliorhinus canicula TaxID=7830 RepID=UPI0018F6724D|nr:tumor necrosis factor receptor superfamily member 14-like isoform X6 [Scyliorhinus canicula]
MEVHVNSVLSLQIIFILVLVLNQQVVMPCGPFEYVHNGGCCSVCSPGTIVYSHCQGNVGTKCKPCTDGKYMEHPNGLEKCRKCKACDQGTHFKDTVCEVCPEGTYSNIDSSTEACVKWTDCKEHKQNQLNPGTSSTDAVCQAQTNPVVIPVAVVGGGGGRSCSFCSGGDCLSLEEKEGTSR